MLDTDPEGPYMLPTCTYRPGPYTYTPCNLQQEIRLSF